MVKKLILIIALLIAGTYGGYYFGLKKGMAPMAMLASAGETYVLTGPLTQKDITPSKSFIALVEPINAVDIKPQVTGTVEQVLFQDGSKVQEGETLFIIEQDKYQANVEAAEAALDKARANVTQIQNDYTRQEKLYNQKFLPKAELEIAESNLMQARAAIKKAEADLKLAKLDLEHTVLTAPITGRIGKALITKGNYVSSQVSSLARLVQTNPIRITFSITDKENLDVYTRIQKGETLNLQVKLMLSDGQILNIKPNAIFTGNEIDKTTATLPVYIEYDNADGLLTPGNYVTVLMNLQNEQQALLVPQTAVLQDANGKYVMKAVGDSAIQQYIEIGPAYENFYIVEKGLTAEDIIILSGAQKVHTGQKIKSTAAQ